MLIFLKKIVLKLKGQGGYTLTELSISTSIIAMLAVGGLAIMQKKGESDKAKETIAKMAVIEDSLKAFIRTNGYLPCPALPALLESNANFGRSESVTLGTPTGAVNSATIYNSTAKTCSNNGLTNGTGAVPVRTLNLPDEYSYDGWDRKFTFRTTDASGNADDFRSPSLKGDLAVVDLKGTQKTNIAEPEPYNYGAIYVLISHGANGKSVAYRRNDASTPSQATGLEMKNTLHVRKIYVQNDKTDLFDDIVIFGTKNRLERQSVAESQYKINNLACETALLLARDGRSTLDNYANQTDQYGVPYTNRANTIFKSSRILAELCKNRQRAEGIKPDTFPGLKLWLDAADRATIFTGACDTTATPTNGQGVACWKDKSGMGYQAASVLSAPTLSTSSHNGKNTLRFDGNTNSFSIPNFVLGSHRTILAAVANDNNGTIGGFIIEQSADAALNSGFWMYANEGIPSHIKQGAQTISTSDFILFNTQWFGTRFGLIEQVYDGATLSTIKNGAVLATANGVITNNNITNTLYIGARAGTTLEHAGNVGEIIIYNRALTTPERQKIEEYLGDKWGIPITAEMSTCPPGMVFQKTSDDPIGSCKCSAGSIYVNELAIKNACYFTTAKTKYGSCVTKVNAPTYTDAPSQNGMALWLDANDCTSVLLENALGGVKTWLDKSPVSPPNNVTQTTTSKQPVYTLNAINSKSAIKFSSSNATSLQKSFTASLNPANGTVFVVANTASDAPGYTAPFSTRREGSNTGYILYINNSSPVYNWVTDFYHSVDSLGATTSGLTSQARGRVKPDIIKFNFGSTGIKLGVNGNVTTATTKSSVSLTPSVTPTNTSIGSGNTNTQYNYKGDIGEVILYNYSLSSQEEDTVEQYLATKWGIIRKPKDVSNLRLWLDASDSSTVYVDNTCSTTLASQYDRVGCWKDGSGNGLNATQPTASYKPKYILSALNNRPTIRFDGLNDRLTRTGALGISGSGAGTIFTVQHQILSTSNVNAIFYHGSATGVNGAMQILDVQSNAAPAAGFRYFNGNRVFNYQVGTPQFVATWTWAAGAQYQQRDLYINGTIPTPSNSSTTVPNISDDQYIIGGEMNNGTGIVSSLFRGDAAEIIVYNTKLTDVQRQSIEQYLADKWGVTMAYP